MRILLGIFFSITWVGPCKPNSESRIRPIWNLNPESMPFLLSTTWCFFECGLFEIWIQNPWTPPYRAQRNTPVFGSFLTLVLYSLSDLLDFSLSMEKQQTSTSASFPICKEIFCWFLYRETESFPWISCWSRFRCLLPSGFPAGNQCVTISQLEIYWGFP